MHKDFYVSKENWNQLDYYTQEDNETYYIVFSFYAIYTSQ